MPEPDQTQTDPPARQTWPGSPYPLGATSRRRRDQLQRVLRGGRAGRALPVRRGRHRGAHRAHRGRRPLLARVPAGRVVGPALRLPGPRPVGPRRGPALQPEQAADRPVRQGHRRPGRLGPGLLPLRLRRPRRRATTTTARRTCPSRWCTARSSTGATTARRRRRCTSRSSTRSTSRASPPPIPTCPSTSAAPTPAWPTPRSSTTSSRSASPRSSCCRCTSSSTTPTSSSAACQLLGLQLDRLLRPPRRLQLERLARPAGAGVQGDGARHARGRHRGDPRRRLQPHRRGQPHGPAGVVQGHRQPGVLPARPRGPAVLLRHDGHREQPQHGPPPHAAAHHGLAALLGHRDARRRLPLRPRRHPRPAVLRGRPALGLLRPRPAGPGRQPGQAHRRAVGPRRRRLPGGQLPAGVVRVERPLPRRRPRLLAGRARHGPRPRVVPHRFVRPLRQRHPFARRPASTSSPPTTASPSPTSSPTTTSTTRPTARTTTTARATTARGTAASRARPTTPRSSRLRRRQQRNLLATLLLSQGVPMLLGGDELGRTQGGNNNAYCQDNEISWFDWDAVDADLLEFTRRLVAPAPRPPGVPPPALVLRPARSAARSTSAGAGPTARR